jgi:hypothetical protein
VLAYLVASTEALSVARTTNAWTFTASRPALGASSALRLAGRAAAPRMGLESDVRKGIATIAAGLVLATGMGVPSFAMAEVATPPPAMTQQVQQQAPASLTNEPKEVRYSSFVGLVEKDSIEKVTFSADGQRLVAVDTGGRRQKAGSFLFLSITDSAARRSVARAPQRASALARRAVYSWQSWSSLLRLQ